MRLTNQEIWKAYPKLLELSRVKLPIRASLGVAKIVNKLSKPYEVIGGEVNKLIKKYEKVDPETKKSGIALDSPEMPLYLKDLKVLLDEPWGDNIAFDKVKLPDMVAGTCDKCKHNLDVPLLIEPAILIPLADNFIELV